MAVLVALYFPPQLYFTLKDRANRGIKRRPYRPEAGAEHQGPTGDLRPFSWRCPVVAATALAFVGFLAVTLALSLTETYSYPGCWA